MHEASSEDRTGRLRWVDLATVDRAAAKEFYFLLFGWSAEDRNCGAGSFSTFAAAGAPFASLYQLTLRQAQQGVPSHWTPYVSVRDADAAARRVYDLGGQVIVPPQDVAGFARVSLICDPAGALLGLWQEASASVSPSERPAPP